MVDSDSHTEIVGFSRNRRPLLKNYPWKQQRNLQHDNGSHEHLSRHKSLSHDIFSQVQPHTQSWRRIYAMWENFLQWYGSQAQLFIMEPELCKEILNNKDRTFTKKEPQSFVKKVLGDGLAATTQAEKWAKLRKIANHSFRGESLKTMIPIMIASVETMLERWKSHEGEEIEVVEEFRLFTSEVISITAFGSSYLEEQNIFEMLMKLYSLIFKNFFKVRVSGISKLFRSHDELESHKLEKENNEWKRRQLWE